MPHKVKKCGKKNQKYPKFKQGEAAEFNWRKADFNFSCCDCGLVHTIRFAVSGHRMRMRVWRNNRATGQVRRGRNRNE